MDKKLKKKLLSYSKETLLEALIRSENYISKYYRKAKNVHPDTIARNLILYLDDINKEK